MLLFSPFLVGVVIDDVVVVIAVSFSSKLFTLIFISPEKKIHRVFKAIFCCMGRWEISTAHIFPTFSSYLC